MTEGKNDACKIANWEAKTLHSINEKRTSSNKAMKCEAGARHMYCERGQHCSSGRRRLRTRERNDREWKDRGCIEDRD